MLYTHLNVVGQRLACSMLCCVHIDADRVKGQLRSFISVIHSSLIVFVIKRDVANQITSVVGEGVCVCMLLWICCGNLFSSIKERYINVRYLG